METKTLDQRSADLRRKAAMLFSAVMLGVAIFAALRPGSQIGVPVGADIRAVDELWVLVCAALVFFMQAGFLAYEVGLARPAHSAVVAMKNVIDWTISSVFFFLIGFGLMFGAGNGLLGTDLFLLSGIENLSGTVSGATFFIFQVAFAGTAITLVSGSLVERTTLLAYSSISIAIGAIIYPVFGHWVWGNLLVESNTAWLAELGFHDFAGGSVVHLLGAVVAMVGIVMIGPRIGRFGPDGEVRHFPTPSIGLTLLGIIILWFGWIGFNGGSFLAIDGRVPAVIIVTNLAAVSGLVGAGLTAYLFHGRYAMNTKLVGGAIGGLVAITSGADVVTPIGSLAIGLIAGFLYAVGHDMLLKWKVDDALGVIPAHGLCAIWGLLGLAVFSPSGTFERSVLEQVLVQLVGVLVCVLWAGSTSFLVYRATQALAGLRVSPVDEMNGFDLEGGNEYHPANRGRRAAAKTEQQAADELVGG